MSNRSYTVIYAITRDLGGMNECYHHLRRVWAEHNLAAIDLCKDDALPSYSFHVFVVIEGHADVVSLGKKCLEHAEILGKP